MGRIDVRESGSSMNQQEIIERIEEMTVLDLVELRDELDAHWQEVGRAEE